jgi:serine/threonine-protein kinase
MSFFTNIRADRFITELKEATDVAAPQTQKAIAKLRELGPGAIEPVTAALADADKIATVAYIEVLTGLVNQKTFPKFIESMVTGSPRVIAGVAWALSSSRAFPATMLLDALNTEGIAKSALLDVVTAHRTRLSIRELLSAAYKQEANEKAALFRILGELATDNDLPELVGRLNGKDPVARLHIINILSKFPKPEVSRALQQQLKDTNKLIRAATLAALARMSGPFDMELLCALLRDPEIDVQNKAIDAVIRANDPDTIKYLIPVLKDENEYARRAAVEVLNEVGNAKSIKELLEAVVDDDWWVRSRAADALGKIGGPKVVDAVLHLVGDQDEDVRRAAIEILNQTKDDRACRPSHRCHQGQGLVGQRARGGRARRNRQQARPAAPAGNARDHSRPFAASGGTCARPPRRFQSHRRRVADAHARREGDPARGDILAGETRG